MRSDQFEYKTYLRRLAFNFENNITGPTQAKRQKTNKVMKVYNSDALKTRSCLGFIRSSSFFFVFRYDTCLFYHVYRLTGAIRSGTLTKISS